jgi:hypothetical protein
LEYYHAGGFEDSELSGYYNHHRYADPGEATKLSPFVESDLDLFLVGLTPEQAIAKIKHLHSVMN